MTLSIKKWAPILVPVLLFAAFSIVTPSQASAAYDDAYADAAFPNQLPEDPVGIHEYINLTNSGTANDTGGGADLEESFVRVYSGGNTAKSVQIILVDRGVGETKACKQYQIALEIRTDANRVTSIPAISPNGCSVGSGPFNPYEFTIPAGALDQSNEPGHKYNGSRLYEGVMRLKLTNAASPDKTATFKLKITSGNGKLGYSRSTEAGTSTARGVTIYPSARGSNQSGTNCCSSANPPKDHVIKAYFAAPCNAAFPVNSRITWDDDDSGNPNQAGFGEPNGLAVKITERDYSGATTNVINVPPGNYSSISQYGGQNVTMKKFRTYELEFSNVWGGNGIAIYYPTDSSNFHLRCPPTTGGATPSVNASCERITFTVPNDNNTHRYRVYVNNAGSPGTPVDSNGDGDRYNDNVDYGSTASSGSTTTKDLVADNKFVQGTLTYTVVIYNGSLVSSGILSENTQSIGPCFTATCNINVSGQLGGNNVVAGQPFGVTVNITNTGINDLPATFKGYDLSGTLFKDGVWGPNPDGEEYAGFAPARIGAGINPGDTQSRSFTLNAPNDINSRTLRMYPDYWGLGPLGGLCDDAANPGGGPPPVKTFMRYDFDVNVSSSLDNTESPTQATFKSSFIQRGVDVDDTSTRSFFKRRNAVNTALPGFGPFTDSGNFGSTGGDPRPEYEETYNIPVGSYMLGDGYCTGLYLNLGHGWKGPNGEYLNERPAYAGNCRPGIQPPGPCTPGDPNCCPPGNNCGSVQIVENKPYVRFYGEDVVAGGGFGGDPPPLGCNRTDSKILGFTDWLSRQNAAGNRSGSGSQLAAMSLGSITGFTSASMRNTGATLPKGLTFSHDNSAPGQTTDNPFLGGNMSGNGWCMPDYFSTTQFTDPAKKDVRSTPLPNINIMSLPDQQQTVRNLNGTGKVTIRGNPALNYKNHHTIYVHGDAYIDGNIGYDTNYSGGSETIPSFTLVVKGNIYIDSEVTRLDGLYIAQPNPSRANTGRIYTCANSSGDPITNGNTIFSQCGGDESGPRRQLTVNGAFQAQRVILNRAGYSLRDSRFQELAGVSRASEIFNFSPEIYLSPPVFQPNGTSTSGEYDYISVLAPIL